MLMIPACPLLQKVSIDLNMTLNRELDSLRKRLQGNKLSLNVLKTQAMVIGSRPNLKKISTKLVEPPSFSIGGSDVKLVGNVNYFLGNVKIFIR